MSSSEENMRPTPDPAENNAFFPSPYSLSQFTSSKSNLSEASYANPYTGNRWKVLVVGADERYLQTDNDTFFSTGNHPVETFLPMYHIDKAGFSFDIATLSGNSVKFEWWAMPSEDEDVKGLFAKYRDRFISPHKLSDLTKNALGPNSDYIAVFIPGGHGAMIGLPSSHEMKEVLDWAVTYDKFIISLCHGPAAFLAVNDHSIFKGYKICAFPDEMDRQSPSIGYMPGHLTWSFGKKLENIGFEIINKDISGATHQDRKMLTGDSPLAGNALGKLAAKELLKEVHKD